MHEACLEGNDRIVGMLLEEGRKRFGEDYAKAVRKEIIFESSAPNVSYMCKRVLLKVYNLLYKLCKYFDGIEYLKHFPLGT